MSVATAFETRYARDEAQECPEYAPAVAPRRLAVVPSEAPVRRPTVDPRRGASISILRPPAELDSPPLRLTRRGVVVLALAVALLGAALVWLATVSAPSSDGAPAQGPAVVTVSDGDTLWSIAHRVLPGSDPRAAVSRLQQLNHLNGVDLVPGQHLRVR